MDSQPRRNKLARLLPAPQLAHQTGEGSINNPHHPESAGRLPATSPYVRPKRVQVEVACDNCRRKKAKCDATRPICKRCEKKGHECVYSAESDPRTTLAREKKQRVLQNENDQLRDLFRFLHNKPQDEAMEIFRRIRISADPIQVLESVQQAEVLLLPSSGSPSSSCSVRASNDQLERLDAAALEKSAIQVPARPWTVVVGDGLMSEIITTFFIWDDSYWVPAIDQDAFLQDMRFGTVENSKWCTPLLVNAICALRSSFVERVRIFGNITHQNMAEQFLEEAKRLLEREQGRSSLPTVQALALLYLSETSLGRDRPARSYRFSALTMLNRLRLEQRFHGLRDADPLDAIEKRVISRALWGLYVTETRIAYSYNQPSILPSPRVPRPFNDEETINVQDVPNYDVTGRPFADSPCPVPLVPGTSTLCCILSELWNEVMRYLALPSSARGAGDDVQTRKIFYTRLRRFRAQLPKRFQIEYNQSPSTCFLRLHENEIAYTILQTLPNDVLFETPYSSSNTTVKDLVLQHSRCDMWLAEAYLSKWPFDYLVSRALYAGLQPLVPMLSDPATHDLFTRGCMMLRAVSEKLRSVGVLMQTLQALAWGLEQPIPETAMPYLEDWGQQSVEKDLPVAFVLPHQQEIKSLLASDNWADVDNVEGQLGALLERWAMIDG